MTKPPKAPPHSDMDGVREDEVPNIEAANAAGQDHEDLKRAADETVARPAYSTDKSADDRSG